jgi:hypothetical protein
VRQVIIVLVCASATDELVVRSVPRTELSKDFHKGYSLVSPNASHRNHLLKSLSEDLGLPDDGIEININNGDRSRSNKSSRKKGKRGSEDDSQSESTWLETIMKSEDQYLPPSAKTIALKAKILKWMDEGPNDKIIGQHFFSF